MPSLPEMSHDFDALAADLRAASDGRPVVWLPNPGNWGAALTRAATREFLAANDIAFREVGRIGRADLLRALLARDVLVHGGGGAWSDRFPGAWLAVRRAAPWFRRTVVLPSAYGRPVRLDRCSLWARDRGASLAFAPASRFCHDLGFFPGPIDAPAGEGTGWFLRDDALSRTSRPDGPRAPDLSSRGDHLSPLEPFLAEIARFEEIHTDRVHVAIAACRMGRRVHVHAVEGPMLSDLFEASIAPFFPGAVLHR